ncbi:SlyX family protein [Luteimonas sp. e5]
MSENDRIAELETRISFQEQALIQLSDGLAAARNDLAHHERLLMRLVDEIRSARGAGVSVDPGDEPPPPHY